MKEATAETIGQRIGRLRQAHGWTQQALAERIAISRVAVSHIEMDMSTPGERTITLLAGMFKLSPQELVAGTTYPQAKAERLPAVAFSYTALDLDLALLKNDLDWLQRLAASHRHPRLLEEVRARWLPKLEAWRQEMLDQEQATQVEAAFASLRVAANSNRQSTVPDRTTPV